MGVLSEMFVATEDEVRALAPDDLPFERFRTLDLKGITDVELAALSAQIRGLDFEDALDDVSGFLAVDETEGPWFSMLENAFIDALAALPDSSLAAHAKTWATSEELEDWDVNNLRKSLVGIVRLAREAVQQGKTVFVWNSL